MRTLEKLSTSKNRIVTIPGVDSIGYDYLKAFAKLLRRKAIKRNDETTSEEVEVSFLNFANKNVHYQKCVSLLLTNA